MDAKRQLLACLLGLAVYTVRAVIQIRQGATTAHIGLARPYPSLAQFKRELMGKNRYYNLDFSGVTAEELGHLPKDLFAELNRKQAKQIVERFKEEIARHTRPIQFVNALHHLFASQNAIGTKSVNWLSIRDLELIGFDPGIIPVSVVSQKQLEFFVERWSEPRLSPVTKSELQMVNLYEVVDNEHFEAVQMKKRFFKNLHSQQSVEHWPKRLKRRSAESGASVRYLNKDLGVSQSGGYSDDEDEKGGGDGDDSVDEREEDDDNDYYGDGDGDDVIDLEETSNKKRKRRKKKKRSHESKHNWARDGSKSRMRRAAVALLRPTN